MSDDIAALREDLISELCQLGGGNGLVEAERVVDALDAYLAERLPVAAHASEKSEPAGQPGDRAAALLAGGSVGGGDLPSAQVGGGEVEATGHGSPLWCAIMAYARDPCGGTVDVVDREIRALVERAEERGYALGHADQVEHNR